MRRYLNAEERLSQAWLNHHILIMAILIVKIYLFSKSLTAALASNQKTANSLCEKLNNVLNHILFIPEQVATVSQMVIKSALNNTDELIKKFLQLCISIARALIGFTLEIYLGTIGCLCTSFVKGCLDVVTEALEAVTQVVQSAINATIEAFDTALSGLSTIINGILKVVNEVKSIFEGTNTSDVLGAVEKVNMTVASLKSISIPTAYIEELSNLTKKIPDFEDIISDLTSLITLPLSSISYDVGNSSMNLNFTAPDNQSTSYDLLQSTCTEIDNVFEVTIDSTLRLTNYIIFGLAGATAIVFVVIHWLEYRKWSRYQALLHEISIESRQIEIGNLLTDYDHRMFTKITQSASSSWRWFATYMATPTAGKCFLIGTAGIIGVLLQLSILLSMEKKMKSIAKISDSPSLTSFLAQNETTIFLQDAQNQINILQDEFNEEIFASIDSTTSAIYLEIVAASSTISDTIKSIFGSTPFALPLQTIFYCTIGRKLDEIEDGLQWILNNTSVAFPVIPESQLQSYSNQAMSNITIQASNITSEVHEGVHLLILKYKGVLKIELLTSCGFLGLWVVCAAIACIFLLIMPNEDINHPMITDPRPMSQTEKFEYAFPFTDPFSLPGVITGSSRYTDI